jgi:hypothetical protein
MIIVQNSIRVTDEVTSGDITLKSYINKFVPDYDLFDVFHEYILNDSLLSIFRVVESDIMHINFVLVDEYAQDFKNYFDNYWSNQPEDIRNVLYINNDTVLIDDLSDEEILNMYHDPNNYSTTSFSILFT